MVESITQATEVASTLTAPPASLSDLSWLATIIGSALVAWATAYFATRRQLRDHRQAYQTIIWTKQFEALNELLRCFNTFHDSLMKAVLQEVKRSKKYPPSGDLGLKEELRRVTDALATHRLVLPNSVVREVSLYISVLYAPLSSLSINVEALPKTIEDYFTEQVDAYWKFINAARDAIGSDPLAAETGKLIGDTPRLKG